MPIYGTPKRVEHITMLAASWIMTDMAAALAEVFQFRALVDLSGYTQARLTVSVSTVGSTGSEIRAQYSTDQSTWNYLDGSAGPAANITATGLRTAGWVNIAAAARSEVYVRLISIGGDGVTDPAIRLVQLQLR